MRNKKKGIFGLGRSLCPFPAPMAVCKLKRKKRITEEQDYPPMPEVKPPKEDNG